MAKALNFFSTGPRAENRSKETPTIRAEQTEN
jgi:hypothetical protein